ncbi:hypothetical protein MMC31_007420 [Peltigera leucophlebia]|nr:hypothetical protein [Peltigera leucophlebia]
MLTVEEKRAALAPIDLSSVVFDDEEDEDGFACTVSPVSPMPTSLSSPHVTSPIISSSSLSSSPSSPEIPFKNPPAKVCKVLEPSDRSTNFLWPNGIRPLELQGPFHNVRHPFVPNNNDIDEVLNGPSGEMAPSSKPPYDSPKWSWEPRISSMWHAWTYDNDLESVNCGIDQSRSREIWPGKIYEEPIPPPAPHTIEDQAVAKAGDRWLNEVLTETKEEMVPFARPPITCYERDLELGLTVVEDVGTIEKEKEGGLSSGPLVTQVGKDFRILGVLSLVAFVGLCFLG